MVNLFSSKSSSRKVASERLKVILIHDRNDLSNELLELIRHEMPQVINKYIEIDISAVEVKLAQSSTSEGDYSILVANIPIKKM